MSSPTLTREQIIAQKLGLTSIEIWVDPATSGRGDRTGMVAVGGDSPDRWPDGLRRAYILEDATELLGVEGWARKAAEMARRWGTIRIGGERNRMGDAVKVIMQSVLPELIFIGVDATSGTGGKAMRADPVKAVSHQGRVIFIGHHPTLEADMTQWVPDDGDKPEMDLEEVSVVEDGVFTGSPDALDAAVHGVRSILNLTSNRIGATMAVSEIMDSALSGSSLWFES